MIPVPPADLAVRRCVWVRVLVLLLVLLAPGAPLEVQAVPVAAVSGESGGAGVEYDVLDSVLRPRAGVDRRPVPRLRAVPAPDARQPYDDRCHVPVPPSRPYGLCARRSVVLRC